MSKPKAPQFVDGAGDPIVPDADYYIQDTRQIVGNCVLWWCANGNGYTCSLNEAGVYRGTHATDRRGTDVYWPADEVREWAVQHVKIDPLHRYKERREQARRGK